MIFTGKTYDVLKKLALVWMPAFATFYFGIAQVWHLPAAEEVVGTITLLDTLLGVGLGISSNQFNKQQEENKPDGDLIVSQDEGQTYYALGISKDAHANILDKSTVTLSVVKNDPPAA